MATPADRRSPTPGAVHTRDGIRRLKAAMAQHRFVLHYQPLAAARDGGVTGVEALLRWRDPQEETDAIEDLLRSAERSAVIVKIENWTLAEAFAAAAAWAKEGLTGVRVNVNLSAREFLRADLVRRIERQLARGGISPDSVGLEITETTRMPEIGTVAAQLDRPLLAGMAEPPARARGQDPRRLRAAAVRGGPLPDHRRPRHRSGPRPPPGRDRGGGGDGGAARLPGRPRL
jgi:hypothetical protein